MTTEATQLASITKQNGLSAESANLVIEAFSPFYLSALQLVEGAKAIEVKGPGDAEGIARARTERLKLREVRCAAENTRKSLKDESLRYGKAIDRVAGVIKEVIEPVEAALLEQEKIAERMEEFRKSELKAQREEELRPLGVDVSLYQLGEMPDSTYKSLVVTLKREHEERQQREHEEREKAQMAEAERVEKERLLRAENDRLRAERQAADKAAAEERAKLEATAKAEREAREKAEAELKAQKDAEAKRVADAEKAQRKAARAPDKTKLLAIAAQVDSIPMPDSMVSSPEARALLLDFRIKAAALSEYIRDRAGAL